MNNVGSGAEVIMHVACQNARQNMAKESEIDCPRSATKAYRKVHTAYALV